MTTDGGAAAEATVGVTTSVAAACITGVEASRGYWYWYWAGTGRSGASVNEFNVYDDRAGGVWAYPEPGPSTPHTTAHSNILRIRSPLTVCRAPRRTAAASGRRIRRNPCFWNNRHL
jgi:hypothetical protein